ncbi:MAG TPA: DUF378 domain-containing protein [Patescibacteria group bacterium]|nr:DUF378 domain-containing protein [Patescibacteria group bacterium]
MKILHIASYILVFIGGLNWGLMGLFNLNLVDALIGSAPQVEKIVYILVGVATIYLIATHKTYCKYCSTK